MDAANDDFIPVQLNFLRWFAAEPWLPPGMECPLTADSALAWFCRTVDGPLLITLRDRYRQITCYDAQFAMIPVQRVLAEKILLPLHQAKVAFILGHELGCIALSGLVGEMLAILRFEISPFGSGDSALSKAKQKRLFGDVFENAQHSRRVGLLELMGLIGSEVSGGFRELAKCRNAYLHRLSHPHMTMTADALRAYELATKLAVAITGFRIEGRCAVFSPELISFIER